MTLGKLSNTLCFDKISYKFVLKLINLYLLCSMASILQQVFLGSRILNFYNRNGNHPIYTDTKSRKPNFDLLYFIYSRNQFIITITGKTAGKRNKKLDCFQNILNFFLAHQENEIISIYLFYFLFF